MGFQSTGVESLGNDDSGCMRTYSLALCKGPSHCDSIRLVPFDGETNGAINVFWNGDLVRQVRSDADFVRQLAFTFAIHPTGMCSMDSGRMGKP
jgi:hypothetical protein